MKKGKKRKRKGNEKKYKMNFLYFLMGCDYYIDKDIIIYFQDNSRHSINVENERGYFYDIDIDEDEDDYEKEYEKSIQTQLEPKMKPIILYTDHSFCNNAFELKYKNLIDYELLRIGKTWVHIVKIKKVEYRYERD